MNPLVRSLFHELVDLSSNERERVLASRGVVPDIRNEVESLLSFDETPAAGSTCISHDEAIHWGPYRQIRLLGQGGMGMVYLAERIDGEIHTKVAVKVLRDDADRPAWRERFLKERQLLAYLNHPSIAHLIDAGHTPDGRPYLVMEYVEGAPIDIYCDQMELREQLKLFIRVCEGVSHAHQRLVIHRDLKPSNIVVNEAGQPKLLDFGIAKLMNPTGSRTQTMDRLLTPDYASPEQLMGQGESTATDVYSLGAVLHKVLTDQLPNAVQNTASNLPKDLHCILQMALREEPEERYPSVDAFAVDIQAYLDLKPVEARAGDRWYRSRKALRQYWFPVSVALLLIVGLSFGMYAINRERTIAQQRFQQLRQLANKVLALDQVLGGLQGSTKARSEIVAMSKDYLDGLQVAAHSDIGLAMEAGAAYHSLAMLQGVPAYPNLGQSSEAAESLKKADALIARVLAVSPRDRKALLVSAEINHDRMILSDTNHQNTATLSYARTAAATLDNLLNLGPLSEPELISAAQILSNIALACKNLDLYGDSIRYARRALEISQKLHFPAVFESNAFSILADSLRYSGDLDGALQTIEAAVAIAQTGALESEARRPSLMFNVLWREGLILGEDGQISLGRHNDAIAVLQRAYDVLDDWAGKDADDVSSRVLFQSAGRELGNLLRDRDPARSLAVFDHSIARLEEVKNNSSIRRRKAELMAASSYPLRRLKRFSEAKQRIDGALQLLSDLNAYPVETVPLGNEVEAVLRARSDDYAANGLATRALESYQELLDKVMASHPNAENDIRHAAGLSRIYEAMTDLLLRAGQKERAAAVSAMRLKLWQTWQAKLPQNPYIKNQLSATH